MRTLFLSLFLVSLRLCTVDTADAGRVLTVNNASVLTWNGQAILSFDTAQKPCALYVAVRSSAWGSTSFGREMDDAMVQWNMCPGGTMVACTTVPNASGGPVMVGIPWPY